jgi:hypothetical protein
MYPDILSANGFDNPWYWLLVIVIWLRSLQWTFGIPKYMMRSAIKGDEQAKSDVLALLDIHTRAIVSEFNLYGSALVLLICFVLASIATLGFSHDITILQAIFFIAVPMSLLGAFDVRLSYQILSKKSDWDAFCKIYKRYFWIKVTFASVFIYASMQWAQYLKLRPYLEFF